VTVATMFALPKDFIKAERLKKIRSRKMSSKNVAK
jgi:hypothetical protein